MPRPRAESYYDDDYDAGDDYDDLYDAYEEDVRDIDTYYDQRQNPWRGDSQTNLIPRGYDDNQTRQLWNWGEGAPLAAGGFQVGSHIYNNQYDENDPWLRDKKGRYYYFKKKAPGDLIGDNSSQTLNRVPKNFLNEFGYNTLGLRGNAAPRDMPDISVLSGLGDKFRPAGFTDKEWAEFSGGSDLPHAPTSLPSGSGTISHQGPGGKPTKPGYKPSADSLQGLGPSASKQVILKDQYVARGNPQPQIKQEEGCIVYSGREYVQDVFGITGTLLPSPVNSNGYYKISCNPGLYTFGPQIAAIGQNFQLYKFRKLVFHYVTTSTDSLTSSNQNSQLTQICMNCLYNTAAPDFITKQQMENTGESVVCKASKDCKFVVNCVSNPRYLYVRSDPNTISGYNINAPVAGPQLTDWCNFYIYALNSQVGTTVGELHIEFECELSQPAVQGTLSGFQNLYWRCIWANQNSYTSALNLASPTNAHGNVNMYITNIGYNLGYSSFLLHFPTSISSGVYQVILTFAINSNITMLPVTAYQAFLTQIVNTSTTQLTPMALAGYNSPNGSGDNILEIVASGQFNGVGGTYTPVFETYSCYTNKNPGTGMVAASANSGDIRSFTSIAFFQVLRNNASIPFQIPVLQVNTDTFNGGSVLVQQCNPDLVNSWNTGFYVNG